MSLEASPSVNSTRRGLSDFLDFLSAWSKSLCQPLPPAHALDTKAAKTSTRNLMMPAIL